MSSFQTPIQEPSFNPSETVEPIESPILEPPPMNTTNPDQETQENPQLNSNLEPQENEEQEEEEEGECGFCLFMKGGECKESFVSWEKCIQDAEKNQEDILDKCFEITATLKKCMEAHSDYYDPVLRAEKAAEAVEQLEKEKEKGGVFQELKKEEEKAKEDEKS